MTGRQALIAAGLLGALGVAAGAFGAHGLRATLDPRSLEIWETAARYQQIHAAVLLAIALATPTPPTTLRRLTLALFTGGILVFAGTLYPLALGGPRILGAITPLGGLALIAGWLTLAADGLRQASSKSPS